MSMQDSDKNVPPGTNGGQASPGPSSPPFLDALLEAVRRQKNPLFLMVIAYAIIVVGAGIWGAQILQSLLVPLTIIFVVAVVAWVIVGLAAQRSKASTTPGAVRGGPADVGPAVHGEGLHVGGGEASGNGGIVTGGAARVGFFSRLKNSTVHGGDATSNVRDGKTPKRTGNATRKVGHAKTPEK